MPSKSKEERVLELFLNEPTRHWHFHDIVKTARISEPSANKWLKKLKNEKIINHVKPKGKMPYFQGNWTHANYDNKKRIYAMQKLYETGLLSELQMLKNAKTIILFGSWYRGDWNAKSDVDVFIYGDAEHFRFGMPWKGLGFQGKSREVQVHSFSTKKQIKEIRSGLMKNVVKGFFIKGNIHDIAKVIA